MVRGNLSQNTDQNGFDFRRRPNDSKYHSRERLKYWVRKYTYVFGGKAETYIYYEDWDIFGRLLRPFGARVDPKLSIFSRT